MSIEIETIDRFDEIMSKAIGITEVLGCINQDNAKSLCDLSARHAAWAASDYMIEAREIFDELVKQPMRAKRGAK